MTFVYEVFKLLFKQLKERKITFIRALHTSRGVVDLSRVLPRTPDTGNSLSSSLCVQPLFLTFLD